MNFNVEKEGKILWKEKLTKKKGKKNGWP